MADSRIIDYIKSTLSQGFSKEEIRQELLKQGWNKQEVDSAFDIVASEKDELEKLKEQKTGHTGHAKVIETEKNDNWIKVRKEEREKERLEPKTESSRIKAGFILTVIGGILIAANAFSFFFLEIDLLLEYFIDAEFSLARDIMIVSGTDMFIINVLLGGFLVGLAYMIFSFPERERVIGFFVLAVGAIALFMGNGFILGGVFAIMGAIAAILKR